MVPQDLASQRSGATPFRRSSSFFFAQRDPGASTTSGVSMIVGVVFALCSSLQHIASLLSFIDSSFLILVLLPRLLSFLPLRHKPRPRKSACSKSSSTTHHVLRPIRACELHPYKLVLAGANLFVPSHSCSPPVLPLRLCGHIYINNILSLNAVPSTSAF